MSSTILKIHLYELLKQIFRDWQSKHHSNRSKSQNKNTKYKYPRVAALKKDFWKDTDQLIIIKIEHWGISTWFAMRTRAWDYIKISSKNLTSFFKWAGWFIRIRVFRIVIAQSSKYTHLLNWTGGILSINQKKIFVLIPYDYKGLSLKTKKCSIDYFKIKIKKL